MRVLHVTAVFDAVSGGGNAERVAQLCRGLAAENVANTILTTASGLTEVRIAELAPAHVIALPLLSRRFLITAPPSGAEIRKAVADADIVHIVGHWTLLNAWAWRAARSAGKPYVVCPAGALPLFGRSRLLKRVYNALFGRRLIQGASACIAVTAAELPAFADYGVSAGSVAVLPNGIWRTGRSFVRPDAAARRAAGLPQRPFILFLGRLNRIKGPDLLLDAFLALAGRYPEYDLVLAGPDEGMGGELAAKARNSGFGARIHFPGYLGGESKSAALGAAKVLAVPSRQEAMSLVALEAAIAGTPVLVTDQCGFDEIGDHGGEVVAASAEGIAAGLDRMLRDAERLDERGARLQSFAGQNYAWEEIARRHIALFAHCIKSKDRVEA